MIEVQFELIYPNSTLPGSKFIDIICGFTGSGYAGKLEVDNLIRLGAKKNLVDIYSNTFPAQVLIKADGTTIPITHAIFYHESTISHSLNIVFLTGDSQSSNPDAEYLLAETILGIASKLSVLEYMLWQLLSQKPRVFLYGFRHGELERYQYP